MQSLAIKYRPKQFSDVVEQSSTTAILQQQIKDNEIKGAYIFIGAAGTGKTTCARIFANEINHGEGSPIELDAASHNGVDDVRELIKMSQTRSIEGEYKVFILDEVHQFSAGAWSAMLKLIEEPPAKCVFILCTTDYWKIPKTIQSRCQRYMFNRISIEGIVGRLSDILAKENVIQPKDGVDAINFIARLSDGCLRDAITMLDKCLAYGDLTTDNVVKALEMSNYGAFVKLTDALFYSDTKDIVDIVETQYNAGIDLKQFIKQYIDFTLDAMKYHLCDDIEYTRLPEEVLDSLDEFFKADTADVFMKKLLQKLLDIDNGIKWIVSPKNYIEAEFMLW
jgi:DNA polymerase-3 subunit gamma/tau